MNNTKIKDKRVLTIQDISCFGQCSTTVALPIISACGIETAILPTAILSTHTGGFRDFTLRDLSEDMIPISEHWKKEGIAFDAIYTGYFADKKQIEYAKEIIKNNLLYKGLKIVDPVMGDNGKLYKRFDIRFVNKMREFIKDADIILPNITEATFLAEMEYEEKHSKDYIEELIKKLSDICKGSIVLKGIQFTDDKLGIALKKAGEQEIKIIFKDRLKKNSHGTGDCFASSFVGALMAGKDMEYSISLAADFVYEALKVTLEDEEHWYSVKFEKALPLLVDRLRDA